MKSHFLIVMSLTCLVLAGGVRGDSILSENSTDNGKWIKDRDGNGAAISGRDASNPVIEFDYATVSKEILEFTIRTDTNAVMVALGTRGPRVNIKPGEDNKVTIWLGTDPFIEVNDTRDDRVNQTLARQLERDQPQVLALRFSRADGVLLKWRQLPPPAINTPEVVEAEADDQADQAADEAAAAVPAAELLERVGGGLIALHIHREAEGVKSVISTPVFSDRYYVVAPAQLLRGAQRVEAIIPGVDKTINATLKEVDLETGLALLELDTTFAPMARATMQPMTIATTPPVPGDHLWIASLADGRPHMARMPVAKVVDYEDLDRRLQATLSHGPGTKWLEVTGSFSTAQSGSVALNAAGEVVGLPLWLWLDRSRTAVVLRADHLTSLMAQRRTEPLTYAMLTQMLMTVDVPVMQFSSVQTAGDQVPDYLRRVALVLNNAHECQACRGVGAIATRQIVGYEQFGNMRRPIHQSVYHTCTRCEGSGLIDTQAMQRALNTVVSTTARLDMTHRDAVTTLPTVRDTLRDVALAHLTAFETLNNTRFRQLFDGGAANIGQPVVAMGVYTDGVQLPGETRTFAGIRIPGETRGNDTLVLVDGPLLVDRTDSRTAMVTGVLSGFIQRQPGQPPVAVVSHGLIIPLDTTKATERKTAEELNADLEAERRQRQQQIDAERRRIQQQQQQDDRNRRRNY